MCDLSDERMQETATLARGAAPASDIRISTHTCDVSDEAAMMVFRDEVLAAHDSDHINLLFNNAGLSGGGGVVTDTREAWDRCFNVCFNGVRWGVLAFLDAVIASDEGHIVNTSSVNGLWANRARSPPHCLFRGEVRGEGLHRGADQGHGGQCTPRVGVRRDARPHRNIDCAELDELRCSQSDIGRARDDGACQPDVP
jgi:NAD(P)-dependent dehydrogenase (short-subunit alcohol dehydrogenase family)